MLLNKTKKGQALLIVIVVSTLALLIMLTLADRIILSRVNVQRTEEFDRSVAIAENTVNEIIKIIDANPVIAADCLKNVTNSTINTNYSQLDCTALNNLGTSKVYARLSGDANLEVTGNFPLTHIVSDTLTAGKPTSGVFARCDADSNGIKFLITRVILEGNAYRSEKGIYTCGADLNAGNTLGNVKLYSSSSSTQVAGPGAASATNKNTVLIRAKLLEDTGSARIQLSTYNAAGELISGTSKYEFMVTGLGDLGSDSVITFERPLQGNSSYSQSFFDYVYFGEDS